MACVVSSVCGRRYSGKMKRHINAMVVVVDTEVRDKIEQFSPVSQFLNSQLCLLLGRIDDRVCVRSVMYVCVYVFLVHVTQLCTRLNLQTNVCFCMCFECICLQMCERYIEEVVTLWRFPCQKCPDGNPVSHSQPLIHLYLLSFLPS